ncbi:MULTISPECIES: hypothetical protein [Myxococcus]|uniref:hypothetical protein n=1 Tax=Myxococcus TaxID=32 RepID=UPI001142451D|nr:MULTISPECIES: hypothetical protein [Myxococcus]NOK05787.1 hypothetical protein [Myxococcus xanthus]
MATLLAELWQVVENRADPSDWADRAMYEVRSTLRRSLLAAEARMERAGIQTWTLERTVFVAALLGAVWAQHHDTLGTPSVPASGLLAALGVSEEVAAIVSVVVLAVSLLSLVDGAELDSIATREREKAEAEGRQPVTVECSPRAAQLRGRGPWMALVLLAFTFGWVAAVGFAWRQVYPHWRRWYRARRPLGRVRWVPQLPRQCGQTCVAMLTGQQVAEVCEVMGRNAECGELGMAIALQSAGLDLEQDLHPGLPAPTVRALVLLRHELTGAGHWVVWDRGHVVCPAEGPMSPRHADEHWWRHFWQVAGHHQVLPKVAHPLPGYVGELYRMQVGSR